MKIIITCICLFSLLEISAQDNNMLIEYIGTTEGAAAINAIANTPASNAPNRVIGVSGSAVSIDGVGVLGSARTGLFGSGLNENGIGVFASGQFLAGWMAGDLQVDGTIITPASDRRLKTILKSEDNYLQKVLDLETAKFLYKTDQYKQLHLPEREQYGFIAQDLEKTFPHLVHFMGVQLPENRMAAQNEASSIKGINQIGMIPILTKALQEMHTENQKHVSRIDQLEKELKEIKLLLELE